MMRARRAARKTAPFAFGLLLGIVQVGVWTPSVSAVTFTVTKTADTNDGVCNADCSLREAIVSANTTVGTHTITVPAGTYNLTLGELQVGTATGANISITGAGAASTIIRQSAAVCSTGTARVFDLDPVVVGNVAVSISGVTISNGAAQAFGGGAILGGGTNDSLTLSNSVISGNCTTGAFSAAGISWSPDGSVTITNTTFSNNASGQGAGAILYTTGTSVASSRTLTITGSTFSGNSAGATGSAGGALLLGQNGGNSPTFNINGNSFTGNSATNGAGIGGAIYLGGGTLNLGNTAANLFAGNTAGIATSGGLGVRGGTAIATDNWWNCNLGPGVIGTCDRADNSGGSLTFTPWIVLSNAASPNPIQVNQSTTLTADFLHNSNGSGLSLGQIGVLIGQPVTWGSAVRGTLSGAQTAIQSNGTSTSSFTANAAGAGSASATVGSGVGTASITINKADTTATIGTDTPDPTVTGQGYVVTYSVASSTGTSPTAPTGNVTVSDGTSSCSGTIAAGQCTLASMTVGSKTLTATYGGDANFNASPASGGIAHTVNKADTTTAITADSPDPSVVGQSIAIVYSVTASPPGGGTPTGIVTVSDGTQSCTGTVAAGQCTITFTSAGARSLSATYAGDANYNGSTSAAEAHQVNPANTTTTITSDVPDPSDGGAPVTVDYTVTVQSPGAGIPTGNVTVSDGIDSCTSTVAAGTCDVTLTTPGPRTLTATYAGEADFNGSTSAGEPHTVSTSPTTTAITSDVPDPSVVGQSVTVQYSVTASSGTPTGNVTVSDGTQSCTGTVAAGQCSITFTSAGTKSLTATYAGDLSFSASTSAAEAHQVDPADTTTTITSDVPDPSQVGQSVIVQYTVAANAPGSGIPTGNVTVSDGTISCTGTVAAGQCTLIFTSVGQKTLTATYAGDTDFNGSTSAGEDHQVVQAPTTTLIISQVPNPSTVGDPVVVQFTVTPVTSGIPTGNVTVSDGTVSCTGIVAAGQCSLTFPSSGIHTLTATYAGDSNFASSVSSPVTQLVNGIPTTTTILSDNPDPSVVGQSVTVQYAVSPGAPGTPTGNVTVSDGTISCTGTVAAGQCSLTFTSAGTKSLTATYLGDSAFLASASAAEAHQVNKADTTTMITSDLPDPSIQGSVVLVQFGVTVNSPGAGIPTGNVTVTDGIDSCTGTVSSGQCSVTLTTIGARTLTAIYSGDANLNSSTSAGEPHTVNPPNSPPTADAGGPYTILEGDGLHLDASGSSDPDNDALTYSWDVNGDGTFGDATGVTPTLSWTQLVALGINDGPHTFAIRVQVDDGHGHTVISNPATLQLDNRAPTGGIAGTPLNAVAGQPINVTFTATDQSPVDQAAGFGWSILWGDASVDSVSGGSPRTVGHPYANVGVYLVSMQATDKDGGQSVAVNATVTVAGAQLAGNPCGSGSALVVGGTAGDDTIKISSVSGKIQVTLNGVNLGQFTPSMLIVSGQAGNDTITIDSKVTLPRIIYGNDGNDTISSGNGNGVTIGGAGDDKISTGNARDVLIGGTGADKLDAGNGDDILVAGSTSYDNATAANQAALCGIAAEWNRDLSYSARINHLTGAVPGGLNGTSYLKGPGAGQTVFDDASVDNLKGGLGLDWFLMNSSGSGVIDTSDRSGTEVVTDL